MRYQRPEDLGDRLVVTRTRTVSADVLVEEIDRAVRHLTDVRCVRHRDSQQLVEREARADDLQPRAGHFQVGLVEALLPAHLDWLHQASSLDGLDQRSWHARLPGELLARQSPAADPVRH